MKAVILTSGGLDSAVALRWAVERGFELRGITFDYHLRPEAEKAAVRAQFEALDLPEPVVVPLPFLREAEDVPSGERANPGLDPDASRAGSPSAAPATVPEGYIPARNLAFYAIAAHHAELWDAPHLIGGHNGGDGDDFPDATPDFFEALTELVNRGLVSGMEVQVHLPLKARTKADVVRLGADLGVDFAWTWSCNLDGDLHCGTCSSCVERREAFAEAGIEDPVRFAEEPPLAPEAEVGP